MSDQIEGLPRDDGVECPKCHHVDLDSGEWHDRWEACGEYECPKCGHEFMASRTLSVSYRSWEKGERP